MSINSISNHFREIIKDRRELAQHSSSRLYEIHLNALDSWHAKLPLYVCLQTPTSESSYMVHRGASYERKTAIVRLNFMLAKDICQC
jgi:hypothetical protein